jgi:hypothetical protein
MKLNLWKIVLTAWIGLSIQACGGDDPDPIPPKTAEEIAVEALTGTGSQTWAISGGGKVTKDGADVTALYPSFELLLYAGTSKTYNAKNSNDLFDTNGNWSFAGVNYDKIMLTGSKPAAAREMSFTQSGDNLKLLFSIPAPGGRINGQLAVAGVYVFDLVKK